jgi:hypothetical protein
MVLTSQLFKNSAALQACAVKDAAHVTRGAHGDHDSRIQFALSALDGLKIDHTELDTSFYGRSTAAAVLRYKKKRQIINHTYQSTVDDIVGKMTIASLDKEMRLREQLPKPPGDCAVSPMSFSDPLPSPSSSLAVSPDSSRAVSKGLKTTGSKQFGGVVPVFFQITLRSSMEDGFPLSAYIEVARDLLFQYGIQLAVRFKEGFADTIRFPEKIISSFGNPVDNVDDLRKASEDVRPGVPGVLRVIVCQMAGDSDGETFRNRIINGKTVPPFVYLNSLSSDNSRATLLHEMIHVSKNGPVPHDDKDPSSVFYPYSSSKPGSIDRRVLPPEHAATLSKIASKL